MWKVAMIAALLFLSACRDNGDSLNKVAVSTPTSEISVQVNSPIIEKAGDAEQCMVSLTAARDNFTYEDKGNVTNLVMHSILSSQLYLNRKYGALLDTAHNTVTDLANDPMPIFFDDKGETKLIYPGLSYQDKVISIDMSEGGFQKMVAEWSEAIKPWEVDASQLKGLAGCSVLPFKDIKFSSKGGATRIMKPDDEKSNIYDYINTLNMWSDDALAAQKYAERIGKGNSTTDEGAPNQQFVYLYCPSCEIESLVLQNMKEEKRSVMEIKFEEVEESEGWHIFKAEAEESLWLDSSPFLLDDISGYSQFSLHANDQSYVLTNQVVAAATDSSDGIDDIVGSYYSGQTLLTINSFEDGTLSGSLSSASHNFSKIAEVEFTGEVKNDRIQFDFEGDGYGTEGASKGVLSLNKDNFIVDLQLVQNNFGWSLPEGKTSFSRSLRTYNMAESDPTLSNVEDLIDLYVFSWVNAVNDNDFASISDYLDPNSELYALEESYIQDNYEKGITMKLLDTQIDEIQKTTENKFELSVTITLESTEKGKTSKQIAKKEFGVVKQQDGRTMINKITTTLE